MRRISMLLTMLVLAAMVLAACGGEERSTNVPSTNVPPITSEVTATEVSTATEMPTEVGAATETPGVPVTGENNPARLSNEITFTVQDQSGNQVGNVSDMVLDLDNTKVAYVVVSTTDNKTILIPWDSLQLQTATGGNAFILQSNVDLSSAPEFDMNSLPQKGQPAGDWDASIRSFWQSGGTGTGTGTGLATATPGTGTGTGLETATPSTGTGGTGLATATTSAGTGTGTGLATATTSAGTGGTGLATATTSAGTGAGTGTGTGMGQLQGVMLATELLGSTVTLGTGTDTGTGGTGLATATTSAGTGGGTGLATATATPGTGTGTGSETATIDDAIIETATGNITYLVVKTTVNGTETLIPVPLSVFGWDNGMQQLVLNVDTATLQNAPSFQNGQYPDTTTAGWDSEFNTYWQNNGGSGSGTGSGGIGATATATP